MRESTDKSNTPADAGKTATTTSAMGQSPQLIMRALQLDDFFHYAKLKERRHIIDMQRTQAKKREILEKYPKDERGIAFVDEYQPLVEEERQFNQMIYSFRQSGIRQAWPQKLGKCPVSSKEELESTLGEQLITLRNNRKW